MLSKHHVIIVPGLGNDVQKHIWATRSWKRFGIIPHVFDVRWKIEEPEIQSKLDRAIKLVDDLTTKGNNVSLVGNSAGSSFVLNVFGQRRKGIHKVVINCGRITAGDWPWFTFDQASKLSPSFKESVLMSERLITKLSAEEKKKILTLRPIFDEVVPPLTVPIVGARNEITPSIEHVVSIALNMTLMKSKIIKFLLEE